MRYTARPWLAVVPWSQVRLNHGAIATVLPHWPIYQRRIMLAGRAPVVFTPEPASFVEVCEPDESEALATLALAFGQPEVLATLDGLSGEWWRAPAVTPDNVLGHLRAMHGAYTQNPRGSYLPRSVADGLRHHYLEHQQLLVHPLHTNHFHER